MWTHSLRPVARRFVLVALLVIAGPALARRAPVVPPDELGPFAVGQMTFELMDESRDRLLIVDAWYPVDPEDAVGAPATYSLVFAELVSLVALVGPPVSDAGRFALVAFSHGNGGIRFQSIFLTELLASHGFVVVAPDHTGNSALDFLLGTSLPLEQVAFDRPKDISFVITRMLEKNRDPEDPFYRSIRPRRIAATGHSFGGFTALAMASGFSAADLGVPLPADLEPVPPDRRVRVIVPMAPASSLLSDAELESIRVPTLILGGTLDETTPIEPESRRPFELLSSRYALRTDIQGANHFSFSNACDILKALLTAGIAPDFLLEFFGAEFFDSCGTSVVLEDKEVHRIVNAYAVAFLQFFLNRDRRYGLFLTPGYAAAFEPDVELFLKTPR